jgi:spore coat protein A, manganese oxidase
MKRKIMMKRVLTFIILLFLSYPEVTNAQLTPVADPLYTEPVADPLAIPKFVNPLPIVPRIDYTSGGTTTIYMGSGTHDFGLGIPLNTTVWGYNTTNTFGYLGPTLVTRKDIPLTVQWVNNLGYNHPLRIDTTLHWAFSPAHGMASMYSIDVNGVPAVPHLHGGNTESASDGLPEQWWTPLGPNHVKGMDWVKYNFFYENNQEAAILWYHDHALGITRQNVYMGLAGFYLLKDDNEVDLIEDNKIPGGDQDIEIVIQDKMFFPDGQLAYPDVPAPNTAGFLPWPGGPSAQPEFFGEVITVNGKAWPYLDVQPRKYRFRMLNGSDSRFYVLKLNTDIKNAEAINWIVIGSDQGFLNSPEPVKELIIAPGERYDVVLDFSDPALLGKTIIVKNSGKVPFPKGTPVNPQTTGLIMAFRVGSTPVNDPVVLAESLREAPIPDLVADNSRKLMLFEAMDAYGRMQPMLGIIDPESENDGTLTWSDETTEFPVLNTTEVWEIFNATVDGHPMHLHLVQFRILDRQKYTATVTTKMNMGHNHLMSMGGKLSNIKLKGKASKPDLHEAGWKDTGIMYPGEVTRIIASFERIGEYVWHCHILSHEDHEMMRRFEVVPEVLPKTPSAITGITEYSLEQNYPNPFNPVTTIKFTVPENSFISLKIYNSLGEEVGVLLNQQLPKGNHRVEFNAGNLNSGMYFYTLTGSNYKETRKMLLLK